MQEELLFGKYRILRLLANGSGGEVFLAEHKVLGERRVIKRLCKKRPFYRERLKEAHILKQLRHAAIPCIYDIEEDDDASYIIEEDMGGEPLNEVLIRQKCLPTSFISHYSIQLCEIIEYLHRKGILYLDVKPENLMINGDRLSLIDFGGATDKQGPQRVVFGTDGFAAPEQYRGEAREYSDVYGIGCIIGVMLGKGKKKGKELNEIYQRCVRPLPSERYQSVSELKEDLQRLCYGKQKAGGNAKKAGAKENGTYCIGVTGVHEGTDTAAVCTLLAGHFSEKEKGRIACIDLSGRFVFQKLFKSLFGGKKEIPEEFTLRGIRYVTGDSPSVIGSCAAQGFSVLVINFGSCFERFENEFFRCGSRFVLGDLYPWRLCDWEEFLNRLPKELLRHGVTALVAGGEAEEIPLRLHKVLYLPPLRDVLYPDPKTEEFIRKLFR
ncbi:MAG: serine/threonine protein kinase [Lachnospiraceae bacterium]|nr:serine/threonine protein kinase [Lachnospiraceae bacterium]